MTIREQTKPRLQALVGLPLWGIGQSANLTWFELGNRRIVIDRKGDSKEVGEYAIHVQCPWRISGESSILYGSGDDVDTNIDVNSSVQSIDIDNLGGLSLLLEGDTMLVIFPDFQEDGEYWRIFQPYTQNEHLVMTSKGVIID